MLDCATLFLPPTYWTNSDIVEWGLRHTILELPALHRIMMIYAMLSY